MQALPFLDTEVYPVSQGVFTANMTQREGMISYVENTSKSKWSVHHLVFNCTGVGWGAGGDEALLLNFSTVILQVLIR